MENNGNFPILAFGDYMERDSQNDNLALQQNIKTRLILCVNLDFFYKLKINHYLCTIKTENMEPVNRIKIVLFEKNRTSKWLSEQMGVTPSTVSKWCTNVSQPDLNSLLKISDLLQVDIKELIVREYKQYLISQESK